MPMTFATALVMLEQSSTTQSLPDTVADFLRQNKQQLQKPHEPFPASPSTGAAGQLVPQPKAQSTTSSALTTDVATRFNMNDKQAVVALDALKHLTSSSTSLQRSATKLSIEDWDKLTAFVFEERMAIIAIVAWTLRAQQSDDSENPGHQLAAELATDIATPTFCDNVLAAFLDRTRQRLPDHVRTSPSYSLFWAKQLLREQKALLELIFLAFYFPAPATGAQTKALLSIVRQTEWGHRQETFGYFDDECQAIVNDIQHLLNVVSVESLNLESIMDQPTAVPSPGDKHLPTDSLLHPTNLIQVNDEVEALVKQDSVKSSMVLLGWSYILSRVTNALLDQGVPDAYHVFASRALRVEVASTSSSSSVTTQPLFQLYAAHALAPSTSLFNTMTAVLSSSLIGGTGQVDHVGIETQNAGSTEPNVVGYLSVMRGLLTSVPLLVRLSFLSQEQYADLVTTFATLYGNRTAMDLCAQFWQDYLSGDVDESTLEPVIKSTHSAGEAEVIGLAQSRFPVQLGNLLTITRALSAGVATGLNSNNEDEQSDVADEERTEQARRCAMYTFMFLSTLPTLTQVVPSAPSVTPLPYEVATYPEVVYRATGPIPVSRLIMVQPGTTGRLVSQQGRKPVAVAWDMSWSALKLFAEVLQDFAGITNMRTSKTEDVFQSDVSSKGLQMNWSSEEERIKDVVAILDILRLTLQADSSLGRPLVEHLQSGVDDGREQSLDVLEILFRMLEKTLTQSAGDIQPILVSSQVGLVAALLPSYPGGCWTFLRGSTLLFPSTSSAPWTRDSSWRAIVDAERLQGTYPIVMSLLNLVRALVLEYQATWSVSPIDVTNVKREVLVRALSWVKDEVWVNFSSWKFNNASEKCNMATVIVQLYQLVIEDVELCLNAPGSQLDAVSQVVIDALVTRASVAQLTPLLATISTGEEPITLLRKAGRFIEAQAIEVLVRSSLRLIADLLRYQSRSSSTSTTSSLLEKLCLSHIISAGTSSRKDSMQAGLLEQRPELVEAIASFVVAPIETRTAIIAAKVMTLLCLRSASAWAPRPPSFIALLGRSDKAETFVNALLQIASDPSADEGLQVAIWNMTAAIADSQPGLALLMVTGRQYPFVEEGQQQQDAKDSASAGQIVSLAKSIAPPPFKPLPRTALGVGLEIVGTWTEAWEQSPELLMSVLRFFDFVFQHLVDYGTALDGFRNRTKAWQCFVKIAFRDIDEDEPEDEESTRLFCYRVMAKAHAVRIVALDAQNALTKPLPMSATSVQALLSALGTPMQVSNALHAAVVTSCSPSLHQGVLELIREVLPTLDTDKLRTPAAAHALDGSREFGASYVYSLVTLRRRLDGYLSDGEKSLSEDDLDSMIDHVVKLNLNLSLVEAEISNTRSWRQLLDIVSPILQATDDNSNASVKAVPATLTEAGLDLVIKAIADEDRTAHVMTLVQNERLSILLVLVEVLQGVTGVKARDKLVQVFVELARIYTNTALHALESVTQRTLPPLHRTLFRVTYFAFRQLNALTSAEVDTISTEQRQSLLQAVETIMRLVILATRDVLLLARVQRSFDIEQDLSLAISLVSQTVSSLFAPSASVWLAHCQSVDFFRTAFDVFVHMHGLEDDHNNRPLYAQHVLDLCLTLSSANARAAELMALEGLMTALTNNALTANAENGSIRVLSQDGSRRSTQHELWTGMLALTVSVMSAIGDSTHFIEQEIVGFVRLYGSQISLALSWTSDHALTLPGLEELSTILALMRGLMIRAGQSKRAGVGLVSSSTMAMNQVASLFGEQALHLLQQIVYAILHPNHLMGLIEPTDPEERAWIDKDTSAMDSNAIGDEDLNTRPVVASVTLALFGFSRLIVDSLLGFTMAFETLLKEPSDWKAERAVVLPTATVNAHEKASIGTLFDLASFCQDTLRAASTSSKTESASKSNPVALKQPSLSQITCLVPYTTEKMTITAAQTLESLLVLTTTQLGLWLCRDALPNSATSNNVDSTIGSPTMSSNPNEIRRATTLMRREITGELASDLISLLDKALGGKTNSTTTTTTSELSSSLLNPATAAAAASSPGKKEFFVNGQLCLILKQFVHNRLLVVDA
ncbi:hypothetical protein OIO90_000439 [Microbotryomycetes sp. JL221]|nr:hypothetical protein OIO90_000439 [Microbotryomycetes sp. JL221]